MTSLPEYQETDLLHDNESLVTLTQRYRYVCTLLKHFWKRFSREYLVDLREYHRCNMKKGGSTRKKPETVQISENDVVLLHDENLPRSQWRLGGVERLIRGDWDIVREAVVKVAGKKRKPSSLNRPVSKLFPLEVTHKDTEDKIDILPDTEIENVSTRPARRTAAINADSIRQFIDH